MAKKDPAPRNSPYQQSWLLVRLHMMRTSSFVAFSANAVALWNHASKCSLSCTSDTFPPLLLPSPTLHASCLFLIHQQHSMYVFSPSPSSLTLHPFLLSFHSSDPLSTYRFSPEAASIHMGMQDDGLHLLPSTSA